MPPAEIAQKNMEEFMLEHAQMKQVISNFDHSLSNYALKHEIIEYSKELKLYLRAHSFEEQ